MNDLPHHDDLSRWTVTSPDLSGLIHMSRGNDHLYIHPLHPVWISVNPFGKKVISLCDGKRSMSQVASRLARETGADANRLRSNVQLFLDHLGRTEMIDSCGPDRLIDPGKPLDSLFLHITDRCNLACAHCYLGSSPGKDTNMPLSRVLDLIDGAADLGGETLTLSGGEPLARGDIDVIIHHACEKVSDVRVLTNGTLIDGSMAKKLVSCGVHVQVSLDAHDAPRHDAIRGRGAWARALKGIESLQEAGIGEKLNTCLTLTKENIGDAEELLPFAASRNIPLVRMIPLEKTGRGEENWRRLAPSRTVLDRFYRSIYMKKASTFGTGGPRVNGGLSGLVIQIPDRRTRSSWCPVGRTLAIDANGDAYPCSVLMHAPFKIGNVKDHAIEGLLSSPRLSEIAEACRGRRHRIEACRECPWRSLCQGGCAGVAYTWSGSLSSTDGLCETRDFLFREILFGLAGKESDLGKLSIVDEC